jgi:hypothetical protein
MLDVVVRTPTSCPGEIAGVLSAVFGAVCGGLEARAHACARNFPLKSRRICPIQIPGDGNAQEGNVGTSLCIAGIAAVSLVALLARGARRRRRSSIRGMLRGAGPCAMRVRS